MKNKSRTLTTVFIAVLLLISWGVAVTAKSSARKQAELIAEAETMMKDGIYVRAEPLLEEAAGYRGSRQSAAEEDLKKIYLQMIDEQGYGSKYTSLLEKEMARKNASPKVFEEAADYYLKAQQQSDAIGVLRSGVEKTGDKALTDMYEKNRYACEETQIFFDDVTAFYNDYIQVRLNGKWGLAAADGTVAVPCEYDRVSTFSDGEAIVKKGNEVSGVDKDGNRLYLCHDKVSDIGNFGGGCVPVKTDEGWLRAGSSLVLGKMKFQAVGMYENGYAPAEQNGKWGVVDLQGSWFVKPEYDGVITDTLGQCYAQKALFVKKGDKVFLLSDGKQLSDTYEDARPFADGYAAVKKDGKWGFIDAAGKMIINCQYDDALSFSKGLAPVKDGEYWGYISIYGKTAIKPVYLQAGNFSSSGCAPVKTEDGWRILTLLEYKKAAGLL